MKRIHRHSIDAYYGFDHDSREAEVIRAFLRLGRATDRQVAEQLGHADMNAVRPSITKLVEIGALAEVSSTRCLVTRRTVRVCALTNAVGRKTKRPMKSVRIGPKSAFALVRLIARTGRTAKQIVRRALFRYERGLG